MKSLSIFLCAFLLAIAWAGSPGAVVPEQTPADPEVTASSAETEETEEAKALNKSDPEGVYGKGISLEESLALTELLADPAAYEGKTVLVEGTITDVCPMRGCWVELQAAEGEETIRVKVTDGEIVFPLSAKGAPARIEGEVEKIELTLEEARGWAAHEAGSCRISGN